MGLMRSAGDRTVKFRHLQGTLDAELLDAFFALAVGLVDFARLATADEFNGLVRRVVAAMNPFARRPDGRSGGAVAAEVLLYELGLEDTVEVWRRVEAESYIYRGRAKWLLQDGAARMFVPADR